MDFSVAINEVNYLTVVVAAVASMALGAVWYAKPVFGELWLKLTGVTEAKQKQANMAYVMGMAFVKTLIAAFVLALVLYQVDGVVDGATTGLVVGGGLAATSYAVQHLFELRRKKLMVLNEAFIVANFTLIGAILAWL